MLRKAVLRCQQAAAAAAAPIENYSNNREHEFRSSSSSRTTDATSSNSGTTPSITTSSHTDWDFYHADPITNEFTATIVKLSHAHRQQRVMIVPVPRVATNTYYEDWCYQPYVKDHQLRVSNDIFNPAFIAIPRLVLGSMGSAKKKAPSSSGSNNSSSSKKSSSSSKEEDDDIRHLFSSDAKTSSRNAEGDRDDSSSSSTGSSSNGNDTRAASEVNEQQQAPTSAAENVGYFSPLYMPDAIDNNVSRREFVRREQSLPTWIPLAIMTPNALRDRWHPWIARRTRRLVGERYFTHPPEDSRSFVVLLPPHYAASATNALEELGFYVSDQVQVPCGSVPRVMRIMQLGTVSQYLVLAYMWGVIVFMCYNEGGRLRAAYREYQMHIIRAAGRDPVEFGFGVEEAAISAAAEAEEVSRRAAGR